MRRSRRWLVPEVVQTSAMDCGPAALHSLLRGHDLPSSYGRLREACQTDIDGTSIDALEAVANDLGLAAEQVMLPVDWIRLPEAQAFPCIAVLRLANDLTHFAVLWRRHGPFIQVMDPAAGRRWVRWSELKEELYEHAMPVPAAAWVEWMGSDEARAMLVRRARAVGVREPEQIVATALTSGHWDELSRLDAALRLLGAIPDGLRQGHGAAGLAELLAVEGDAPPGEGTIPSRFFSALPAAAEDDEPMVLLRGAVLLKAPALGNAAPAGSLTPELEAARIEGEPKPFRSLFRLIGESGWTGQAAIVGAVVVGALMILVEGLLLRGMFEAGLHLSTLPQRLGGVLALAVFALGLVLIDVSLYAHAHRLGRQLETRLRLRFLAKIPKLPDRYVQSRPVSDLAKRCHDLPDIRMLPVLFAQLALAIGATVAATAGLLWVAPNLWPLSILVAVTAVAVPLLFRKAVEERDLRVRTHAGALGTFYLDAVLAQSAVRAHAAETTVEHEHNGLLTEWARAAWARARSIIALTVSQMAIGLVLAVAILLMFLLSGGSPGAALLVAYWATGLPAQGEEIGYLIRRIPAQRNIALRLLEVLDAPEADAGTPSIEVREGPADIELRGVSVVAGGHEILADVSLRVAPGEHVAVVGRSGAGKSTLLGLLLGWHRAAAGLVAVNGSPITPATLKALRRRTAWVDPGVQVWNRSFAANVRYGRSEDMDLGGAISAADLVGVIGRLDAGMQTPLGESGRRLSGGEGQRVRLARALAASEPSLVLLDEPFRGLERDRRRMLLERARALWRDATLLMVSHDVLDTRTFPRVVVVDGGRIVEDGSPRELEDRGGRYAALLEDERLAARDVWGDPRWRRLQMEEVAL